MMTGRKRILKSLALLPVLAVGVAAAALLPVTGWLEPLDPQAPGQCVRLAGPLGAEDFAVDWQKRRAWVSSADRHAVNTGGKPKGDIFLLDFSGPELTVTPLNVWSDDGFFPHGLDLFTAPDGTQRLFVVNHGADGRQHTVEIFQPGADGRLTHVETVSSSAFSSPNDVAATGPNSFYVTNDPFTEPTWKRLVETYLQAPWNTIAYYDGTRAREVFKGLQFGNGIVVSPDGDWVLAAESVGRSINVFRRNPFDGSLFKTGEIAVPMAADNITVQPDGNVIVAGHPRPLAFQAYAKAPHERRAPSMVLQVPPESLPYKVTAKANLPLPYINDGSEFSASATGVAVDADRLLIGAVYERGILMCTRESR